MTSVTVIRLQSVNRISLGLHSPTQLLTLPQVIGFRKLFLAS